MKKSSKTILVIVAIVLLIGIVVGTYFLVKNKQVTNKKTNELEETSMNLSKVDMVNENNNEVEDKSSNLSKVDITNENNNETEEKSSNNLSKVDIANENNENTNIDVETQNKDDEALYFYSSGDIAAAKGNPEFQYIQVIEEYPSGVNPYAGNGVFFSGEYDKVN